jgi:histidinol-phosphatase (PHP family)
MSIEQAITKSRQLELGIIITEHMDLLYPGSGFMFDVDEYFRDYQKFRSSEVLLGIELGLRTDCTDNFKQLTSKYQFDYVLGSIHVVNNIDLYFETFYRGKTKKEVYREYFKAMADCLREANFIHSLGHIDYIARYKRIADCEAHYHEFPEEFDEVLSILADKGKAIEINTKRFAPEFVPILLPIYRRFAELGGEFATIGSDAHTTHAIGNCFHEALEFAAAAGLKPVYYKNGQVEYMK